MSGVLISETTREERERLVAESLGNIDAACDGCAAGVVEMYQDYIDGKKELREVNMEYRARYVSGMQGPGRKTRPFPAEVRPVPQGGGAFDGRKVAGGLFYVGGG